MVETDAWVSESCPVFVEHPKQAAWRMAAAQDEARKLESLVVVVRPAGWHWVVEETPEVQLPEQIVPVATLPEAELMAEVVSEPQLLGPGRSVEVVVEDQRGSAHCLGPELVVAPAGPRSH